MLIGSIVTDILDTIQSGIFWLLLKLDAIVYTFIDWIYQIILMLADGDLLSNSNLVDELVNRLYLIIGVIILFLVAYSLLRSMVNPDEALKGKESPVKIVQNVIISVVLIAVIPYVFNFAMGFQTSLLQQNTIGRLILGEGSGENASSSTIDDGGFNIAISVFQAFFQPNTSAGYCTGNASIDQNYPDCEDLVAEIGAYNNFEEWWANDVITSKNLFAISEANTLVAQNKISYTFIISTIAGAFVVFVLVSYCIDIAIRLVKLAVFQLIAPLPILARIVPNEQTKKIFSNWLKATISTYVEVFIRLGILFFAVFIIDLVVANFNTIFDTMGNNLGNVNPVLVLIAQALVILGIILFVKQLPGIIKDITGLDGGKYNVFGSAMRGFNTLRSLPKIATQTWNNTNDNPNHGKIWNNANKLKNALLSTGKGVINNHEAEYKGIGDLNKNYEKITTDNLAERRRKEAIRKAKLNRKDRYKREAGLKEQDRAAAIHEYFHGSTDTKAIEEKIKLANSVGKDIKSKIVDEAIDKNLRVKRLDNAWKTLQNKAVDANDYFERVTADNYEKLGLTLNDVGAYYDAQNGRALDYNTAYNEARRLKETQEGALKKQRDNAAFETMWGAINGDFSVFDSSDVDTEEKQKFVYEFFNNLQSQFNENIEYAKAKNPDVASSARLSARIDVSKMSDAKALKDMVGDKKLEADTLATGYDKDLAAANSREQLKAEIKGDKK